MDGSKYKKYSVYHLSNYHTKGPSACHCNTMSEDRLLDIVVRKMQAEVFSETAIDRSSSHTASG